MLRLGKPRYDTSVGVASSIMSDLKSYGRELPITYLARLQGRSRSEIQPYLEGLEAAGLIEISDENVRWLSAT